MSKYKELMGVVKTNMERVTTIFNEIGDNEPDTAQRDELKRLYSEADTAEVKATELKEFEDMRKGAADKTESMKQIVRQFGGDQDEEAEKKGLSFDAQKRQITRPSDAFFGSKDVQEFLKSVKLGEGISRSQFGASPSATLKSVLKSIITGLSSTSAGAFVVNDRLGLVDSAYKRPLTIRDLITVGQTSSDTVEYVREGTPTNNAAPVAEATATSGSSGSKPESAMAMSVVTEAVKTIAHWIPATRRALADAGQIRTYIDSFLMYGLAEELEDQMLTGDGVGENFTEILNTSGRSTQAYDTSIIITTRRARTKVRTLGRAQPTAYVMHPNDWEDMDLTQDNEARYYFGGPTVLGSPRLWGLPVVEAEGMTEGRSVVADWRLAALWDREVANILVSDSHQDFFTRNLIAILAELRAAFGVIRPSAFVDIDLTP